MNHVAFLIVVAASALALPLFAAAHRGTGQSQQIEGEPQPG
jgi:hypothetical protein